MFLVSVWITAFNHEKFIEQAIDSVLMQQTNFEFDIIIGEDCSVDRTREIVLSYKTKYPDKIKLFLPEKNLGCNPMFHASYPLCKGKYIAWLDGDDYWIDPNKLQKQFDFMESNQDIVFCFHKVKMVDEDDRFIEYTESPSRNDDDTLGYKHFLEDFNPVNTPSFFHKNVLGYPLPDWFYTISLVDLGFYFLLLQHGKGKYSEEIMAAYRQHSRGAWTGASYYNQNFKLAQFYEIIQPELPQEFSKKIDDFRCEQYYILFEREMLSGNYKKAKEYFMLLKKKRFAGLSKRKIWALKLFVKFVTGNFGKPLPT